MNGRFSRRKAIYGVAGAVLTRSVEVEATAAPARQWPILEGPDTPKLALALGDGGGPLPGNLRPASQDAAAVNPGGRGAGRAGGGFGGYLQQKSAMASPPVETANGRGTLVAAMLFQLFILARTTTHKGCGYLH